MGVLLETLTETLTVALPWKSRTWRPLGGPGQCLGEQIVVGRLSFGFSAGADSKVFRSRRRRVSRARSGDYQRTRNHPNTRREMNTYFPL
jgi:hypothetical protein